MLRIDHGSSRGRPSRKVYLEMARELQTVIRSDLSGEVIRENEAVSVTIRFANSERNRIMLDAAESEVEDLIKKGREVKPRPKRSGTRSRARTNDR
jgi:hypothetical protein